MQPEARPQLYFLLRATGLFAVLLALWWFVLRPPLLDWVQLSSETVLHALPGVHTPTGVIVEPSHVWTVRVPLPGGRRTVRLEVPERIAVQGTVGLPLYWAVLFAGPWSWRLCRDFAIGTAVLLLFPAFSLLVYAAHVVQLNLYPHTAAALRALLAFLDYVNGTVVPYIVPVLLALALDRDLRLQVFSDTIETGPAQRAKRRDSSRRARSLR